MRTIQIASLPDREKLLKKTIESLINQADRINVFLNGYKKVPDFCHSDKIKATILNNERGDAAKFFNVEDIQGYIFTCDDDLIYPPNYINVMISKLWEYNLNRVVSCHGRVMKAKPVRSYYRDRIIGYRCLGEVYKDVCVDVAGTGCMAFHSDTINLKYEMFELPNMADIWAAKACKRQGVKQVVIEHKEGWIKYQRPTSSTIWDCHFNHDIVQTAAFNGY